METITTDADFKKLLTMDKALVFIFFEWSGQAHFSKKVLIDWKRKSKFNIPLFELLPDELELVSKWVREEVKERGGYGSLSWIKDGRVLEVEFNVGNCSSSEIESKTSELFGS